MKNFDKNKNYGVRLSSNIFLVKLEKSEEWEPAVLLGADIVKEIGKYFTFEHNGKILTSLPMQISVNNVKNSNDDAEGLKIDINVAKIIYEFSNEAIKLIDVRKEDEFKLGHLEDAELICLDDIENEIEDKSFENSTILLYCRSGNRSGFAQEKLEEKGYFALNVGGILDYNGELTTD